MVSKDQHTKNSARGDAHGSINADTLNRLSGKVEGRILLPGDDGYDAARSLFYGGFDHKPDVIVQAAGVDDVCAVVTFARETVQVLAVRSGGHSLAGHSVSDGGITLDLHNMRALEIDPINRTAWAETGLTTGEFTQAVGEYGLATGFGDTGSVGIGGITLGGGVGFLSRKYGLTIDALLAADLVTADGRFIRVDAENHPDLFWAIRGGGGNFGVATRFHYRLFEVPTVVGGILILPATAGVIEGFMTEAGAAPDALSTIANIMPAPPMPFVPAEYHGQLILMAMMTYAGSAEDGARALAPFRGLAAPIADMLKPMQYAEMFLPEEGDYHPMAVAYNMFVDRIDRDAAEKILRYLEASDAPMRVAQLRALGGAISHVPDEATAYAHRQAAIMVNLAAFFSSSEERAAREKWIAEFAKDLNQGYDGAYANFVGDEGQARVHAAYPGTVWERLSAIKARYDPTNLFRLNQNIPPADSAG